MDGHRENWGMIYTFIRYWSVLKLVFFSLVCFPVCSGCELAVHSVKTILVNSCLSQYEVSYVSEF